MQKENIREYELIRDELKNIRNCITTYIGYLIGGSGIAISGIIVLSKKTDDPLSLVGIPLVLSVLVTMVQMIIYYKFLSHNRYAGYCKLLNHERHDILDIDKDPSDKGDLIMWEACLDVLRLADDDKNYAANLCDEKGFSVGRLCMHVKKGKMARYLKYIIRKITGPKPTVDRNKRLYGFRHLSAIIGRVRTSSWAFPAFVNIIFLVLAPIFLIIAVYFLFTSKCFIESSILFDWCWRGIAIVVLGFQIHAWFAFSGKLFTLLDGSNTVSSFCWKFIPFRVIQLNMENIIPKYVFMWCDICDRNKKETSHVC